VVVRLIYDSLGSFGTLEAGFLDALRQAGVEILEYYPVAPWRRNWALNRRNHQKILAVDGEIGFTGGLNIGDEYAPGPDGEGWHDLHVRVHGPAARDLERVFERTWLRGGGLPLSGASGRRPSAPAEQGQVLVQTLDNLGIAARRRMVVAWRRAIRRASTRVTIANAYFIPGRRIRRELRAAIRRGVSVRVLLPARSDVRTVQYASQYLYHRLLRSGIRLHEMHDRMMHAKAAVIDGQWATIGSYNLDRRSLFHNLEVGVVVVDAPFAQRLESEIVKEMAAGREVRLARWQERSLAQRALEWLAYRFRYWL
jgi:cardiolipin synthase